MNTYVLFIYGTFEDHEEVQFFCVEVLGESPIIKSLRYIVEDSEKNIIVIFDSERDKKSIHDDLMILLANETILFHFLFELDGLVGAHVPASMRDFIFKPVNKNEIGKLEFKKIVKPIKNNIDDILEKIRDFGLESLTHEEKKFLDNFEI